MAGFFPALALDIDTDITAAFGANFPATRLFLSDISKADPSWILRKAGLERARICGILGGPPCQGFSSIGKRDHSDPRNELLIHFFRFVVAIEPTFFVLENVPGVLAEPFGKILTLGLERIARSYEVIGPLTINAADFGGATNRKRVFVIGTKLGRLESLKPQDLQCVASKPATVYEAIHDLPSPLPMSGNLVSSDWAKYCNDAEIGPKGEYARKARRSPPQGLSTEEIRQAQKQGFLSGFTSTRHSIAVLKRWANLPQGSSDPISKCPRLQWNSACSTIRAGTGKDRGSYQSIRPIHPVEDRVITVREAARLQGFPDWFQFHPTKWHSFRMIGNSVSPILSTAILSLLKERLGSVV
jgi:DNA (cytosine-5)-methyltransferase 1